MLHFHVWYLDDEVDVGESVEVAKTLNIIRETGSRLGIELNIHKTGLLAFV